MIKMMKDIYMKLNQNCHGKSSIQHEQDFFISKLDLNLRKKLANIWSIALYGTEISTLQKVDQKYLESLKCGAGEGWRRSVGPIV
jgi:hypothetical protein